MANADDPPSASRRYRFRRRRWFPAAVGAVAVVAFTAVVALVGAADATGHRRHPAAASTRLDGPATIGPSRLTVPTGSAPSTGLRVASRATAVRPVGPVGPVGPVRGFGGSPVLDAHVFVGGRGYVTTARSQHWTDDGGASWRDVSPPGLYSRPPSLGAVDPEAIATTADGHQWAAYVSSNVSRTVTVVRRPDVRATWTRSSIDIGNLADDRSGSLKARLSFLDDRTGWLLVTETTTHEFPSELFATTDGGRDWARRADRTTFPNAGASEFHFLTPTVGYLGSTYNGWDWITRDGGRHWTRLTAPPSPASVNRAGAGEATVDGMQYDGNALVLKASYPLGVSGSSFVVGIFRSTDLGRHWSRVTSFAATGNGGASIAVDPTTEHLAVLRSGPARPWILSLWTGSTEIATTPSDPGRQPGPMTIADERHIWVVADDGDALLASDDAAHTWHRLARSG